MNKNINISNDVISTIVSVAIMETEGVAGVVTTVKEGVNKILKKKASIPTGIEIEFTDEHNEKINITASISIKFDYELTEVAKEVQNKIKNAIETMTSLKADKVTVHVVSVNE